MEDANIMKEKKKWWVSNQKIAKRHWIEEAKRLIATGNHTNIASAITILDSALSVSPRFHIAVELKSRSLLLLRRYKQIADMFEDYIPSVANRINVDDECSIPFSSYDHDQQLKLLPSIDDDIDINCFSISNLKKKIMATISKSSNTMEQQYYWRYSVLGQACYHLGLMEDAMLLLQTSKRIAADAFRLKSTSWTDDSFSLNSSLKIITDENIPWKTESENITQLLTQMKFLIRRKTAATAALNAGLYTESVRHFTKLIEGRCPAPQGFIAECYTNRATAYRSLGRIADAIADCNRTLAIDPSCVEALSIRASLFETIRCLTDSLHDLEHMKLLYNSILRDQRFQGGRVWKTKGVQYREIPGRLCCLATKIQRLKQRVAAGETGNVDYYGLIGLKRGISGPSDLERAHLLLRLRHKPDKAIGFLERVEIVENEEEMVESVRDRAKISALWLYRLIIKGYSSVMTTMAMEEEQQRRLLTASSSSSPPAAAFQGVFCRDLVEVVGFNSPIIPVKFEALSC